MSDRDVWGGGNMGGGDVILLCFEDMIYQYELMVRFVSVCRVEIFFLIALMERQ